MATFQLKDTNGNLVVERQNVGRLVLWLKENKYFDKHPDTKLSCTEMFTRNFEMVITPNTTAREIEDAWNRFNFQI